MVFLIFSSEEVEQLFSSESELEEIDERASVGGGEEYFTDDPGN